MILKLSLEALDELEVDAIAVALTSDKRPLSGIASLLDWRMCGHLSRLLEQDKITGEIGETILLPTQGRLNASRIFIFGLGMSDSLHRNFAKQLDTMVKVLSKAQVVSCSINVPDFFEATREIELLQQKRLAFRYAGTFEPDASTLATQDTLF